jgi:hypothetical protein
VCGCGLQKDANEVSLTLKRVNLADATIVYASGKAVPRGTHTACMMKHGNFALPIDV